MNDSPELLRRLGLKPQTEVATAEAIALDDDEDEERGKCFGYLRGARDRATHIELRRQKEGDSLSLPYSWLGPTRFDPSHGIMLVFAASDLIGVRIRGRHLNTLQREGMSLYERGLLRQRVTFIREAIAPARGPGDNECLIERIELMPLQPEQVFEFLHLAGR